MIGFDPEDGSSRGLLVDKAFGGEVVAWRVQERDRVETERSVTLGSMLMV